MVSDATFDWLLFHHFPGKTFSLISLLCSTSVMLEEPELMLLLLLSLPLRLSTGPVTATVSAVHQPTEITAVDVRVPSRSIADMVSSR
jgi:hypothetical protein